MRKKTLKTKKMVKTKISKVYILGMVRCLNIREAVGVVRLEFAFI